MSLLAGTYQFGLSMNGGDTERVDAVFRVDAPTTIVIEHEDRSVFRIVGWVLTAGLVATGLAVALGSAAAYDGSDTGAFLGGFFGGLGVMFSSLAIGLPLAAFWDHRGLRVAR